MAVIIRAFTTDDIELLVRLSLTAWEPVYVSFREVLGPEMYGLVYPDWKQIQAETVRRVCLHLPATVWVAEVDGTLAGFIAYVLRTDERTGVVHLLAVDPAFQNQGVGTRLNAFALDRMRESGMERSELITGGDPGHAPARRSYEKAGYSALPLVRYYRALRP